MKSMKNHAYLGLIALATTFIFLRSKQNVEKKFWQKRELVAAFTYLTSDELMGRDPIRPKSPLLTNFICGTMLKRILVHKPNTERRRLIPNIPFYDVGTSGLKGEIPNWRFGFMFRGKNMLVINEMLFLEKLN